MDGGVGILRELVADRDFNRAPSVTGQGKAPPEVLSEGHSQAKGGSAHRVPRGRCAPFEGEGAAQRSLGVGVTSPQGPPRNGAPPWGKAKAKHSLGVPNEGKI